MRRSFAFIAIVAGWTSAAMAVDLPADPISYLDGYWYGEDRKVELEVKSGVATVKVNESEDAFVRKLGMPPGTVVGRLQTANPAVQTLWPCTGNVGQCSIP